MENTQIRDNIAKQLNYTFDTRKLLASFLANWYWFFISIVVFVTCGVLYLRYTTPVYSIKSSLLIENKESDLSSSLLNKVEGMRTGRDEKGNLFNEILVLKSKDLIQEVVDSIDLNVHYWVKGRVKENELYEESPILLKTQFNQYPADKDIILSVKQVVDGQFEIKEGDKSIRVFYDSWIQTKYGKYKIVYSKREHVNTSYLQNDIKVIIEDPSKTTDNILKNYQVTSSDGRTSMLELSYVDNLPKRGVDFINALIKQYHKNELYNISQFAIKTRDFIIQRQKDLYDNLKTVDTKVVEIQRSSEVVDLASSAESYVKGKTESEKSIQELLIRKKAIENLKIVCLPTMVQILSLPV
jgi:tyrosine-protein kinase Etk/Wzc